MDISKADWKLFRERIPEWQERYMERLNQEYIELLNSSAPASKRFWDIYWLSEGLVLIQNDFNQIDLNKTDYFLYFLSYVAPKSLLFVHHMIK